MGHDLSQDAEIWDDAYKLDRAHVFHSWHAQRNLDPTEVVTGYGVWLKYGDGREMLDFTSQQVNVNIGYQHPKVIEGIKKQAELLCTVGPDYANLARGRAASLVARRAPEGFDKVFFTNAGADANENAMRAARLFTGRDKICLPTAAITATPVRPSAPPVTGAVSPTTTLAATCTSSPRTCIAPSSPQPPRKRSASVRWLTSST